MALDEKALLSNLLLFVIPLYLVLDADVAPGPQSRPG